MLQGIKDSFSSAYSDIKQSLDDLVSDFNTDPTGKNDGTPPISRYPLKLASEEMKGMPYILFAKNAFNYDDTRAFSRNLDDIEDSKITLRPDKYIALYMPLGVVINDTIKYEIQSAGGILAGLIGGEQITMEDFKTKLLQEGRKILGGSGSLGGVVKELYKNVPAQNPKEYVSFQAPSIREFSFSFKFAPTSLLEAIAVKNIIKTFRAGMYPTTQGAISYGFPYGFNIAFKNTSFFPKLPQCALTNCSVTYNPNSSSFYEMINDNLADNYNLLSVGQKQTLSENLINIPTEVDMSLSFQELEPISRQAIMEGF